MFRFIFTSKQYSRNLIVSFFFAGVSSFSSQPPLLGQEHEGCFAIWEGRQLTDLSRSCRQPLQSEIDRGTLASQKAYARGVRYRDQQQLQQAIAEFTRVIALDPSNADAYYGRAVTQNMESNLEAFIEDAELAISIYRRQASSKSRGASNIT